MRTYYKKSNQYCNYLRWHDYIIDVAGKKSSLDMLKSSLSLNRSMVIRIYSSIRCFLPFSYTAIFLIWGKNFMTFWSNKLVLILKTWQHPVMSEKKWSLPVFLFLNWKTSEIFLLLSIFQKMLFLNYCNA